MKRISLVMLVGALLLALIGGVAGAVTVEDTFVCDTIPCFGTNNNDKLGERDGQVSDEIYGKDGRDRINAGRSGNDTDKIYGQDGADRLVTADNDGKDLASGGSGHDTCIVDKGDTKRSCEEVIKR